MLSKRGSGQPQASVARQHDPGDELVLDQPHDRLGNVLRGADAADAPLVTDLVYGSLWYRVSFGVGLLDEAWADGISRLLGRPSAGDPTVA